MSYTFCVNAVQFQKKILNGKRIDELPEKSTDNERQLDPNQSIKEKSNIIKNTNVYPISYIKNHNV